MKFAESITVDPHKTGYLQYSAGGILYANDKIKSQLKFDAPYLGE